MQTTSQRLHGLCIWQGFQVSASITPILTARDAWSRAFQGPIPQLVPSAWRATQVELGSRAQMLKPHSQCLLASWDPSKSPPRLPTLYAPAPQASGKEMQALQKH